MDRIGKYVIRKPLITTNLSDIYAARDPDLGVEVAVKVCAPKGKNSDPDEHYGPEGWRGRLVDEAKVLARLDHPNIVAVRDFGWTATGDPFLVMPFVEANLIYEIGKDETDEDVIASLEQWKRPRRLELDRAVAVLRQVLAGLAYLHRRGMVHRDVKPGNVLLTRKRGGSVKLCDFGMVKFPDRSRSRAGMWIGSLDYISPEQRKSARDVDARADVYSAGGLAYRVLTGRMALGAFASPAELVPGLPRGLSELVMAALAPKKEDRPNDAGEMMSWLNDVLIPWAPPRRRTVREVPAPPAPKAITTLVARPAGGANAPGTGNTRVRVRASARRAPGSARRHAPA